jgi:hypothetical protein
MPSDQYIYCLLLDFINVISDQKVTNVDPDQMALMWGTDVPSDQDLHWLH